MREYRQQAYIQTEYKILHSFITAESPHYGDFLKWTIFNVFFAEMRLESDVHFVFENAMPLRSFNFNF